MSESKNDNSQLFEIKDCSITTISTGLRALNLRELRDRVHECPQESLDYHFFLTKLRPAFDDPEYPNDFAAWASHGLHDRGLAERLGMINPAEHEDNKALRGEILDVIEERLGEHEVFPFARQQQEFIFLRSQMVIFNTGKSISSPEELGKMIPHLSTGSVYYHFIEARRRHQADVDDYTVWLESQGEKYAKLANTLRKVDYYYCSLSELRERVANVFNDIIRTN